LSTVDTGGTPPGDSCGPPDADALAGEARGGPTVLRMLLGTQLRRLREDARITPERAGYEIRASRSKISRLEHGRVSFKHRDVADLRSRPARTAVLQTNSGSTAGFANAAPAIRARRGAASR